jgi:uncharacterized membrane protein
MLRQWCRLGPLRGTIGRTGGRGMNTLRLEAFSDGVLAFAFTLLVLDFRAPYSTAGLFAYLLSLWPQLLGFCISFLLIGLIWANHRAMFLHIEGADRLLIFLNTLLLADVAFLPFPTSLLAKAISSRQGLTEAAFFYGLVLTVGGIFFNGLWLYSGSRMRFARKESARRRRRGISIRYALGPLAYLVATFCSFLSPLLSIALYVLLIVFFWLPGRSEEPLEA